MSSDAPGEVTLCRLEEIEDGQAHGFVLPAAAGAGHAREVEILVYRSGDELRGFLNECPHIGAPMEWMPNRFMSEDGRHLRCANHGALFRPEDGYCVEGPCEGDSLKPVSIALRDGMVIFRPS